MILILRMSADDALYLYHISQKYFVGFHKTEQTFFPYLNLQRSIIP